MALALSTKAKIVAATLTATTLIAGTFSANAQQMAAAGNGPNFAACDKIKDPARSAQCYSDATITFYKSEVAAADARGAQADARGAQADARTTCANEIADLRRNVAFGNQATEIARDLVKASGRPAAEQDVCVLRDGIRAGLTRLKLMPARVSLN